MVFLKIGMRSELEGVLVLPGGCRRCENWGVHTLKKHRTRRIPVLFTYYSSFLRLLNAHSTSRKLTATQAARMINSIAPPLPSSTNMC